MNHKRGQNGHCVWGLCFVVFLPTLDSATVSKCGLLGARQKLEQRENLTRASAGKDGKCKQKRAHRDSDWWNKGTQIRLFADLPKVCCCCYSSEFHNGITTKGLLVHNIFERLPLVGYNLDDCVVSRSHKCPQVSLLCAWNVYTNVCKIYK